MNSKGYKWCAVPLCDNTSKTNPNKLFVHVPRVKNIRYQWFNLAKGNPKAYCLRSPVHFCEDHFDMPNDMENYMQYHVMGSVSQVRMKAGCIPKKFDCQQACKTETSNITGKTASNKQSTISEQIDYDEILSTSRVQRPVTNNMPDNIVYTAKRLFLQMSSECKISVPNQNIAQHQIDAIRFLFEHYRKRKPGVVLNYAAACGKSVSVALFINAIVSELDRPVLILYDQAYEKHMWLVVFAQWTTIVEDEIAVDPTNIFIKKSIILKNAAAVSTCCSRLWSILVMKSEKMDKTFPKWQLKVDFKIWITSVDMMKDLDMLRSIYMWINDSARLKLLLDARLIAYRKSLETKKDRVTNDILLQSFLEDFMLRRRDLKPFIGNIDEVNNQSNLLRMSKKNKDATGKKIKRSLNYVVIQPSDLQIEVESPAINDEATCSKRTRKDLETEEESKMDVESFIRDNEPLETDVNLTMAIKNHEETYYRNMKIQAEERSTDSCLDFGSAVDDLVNVENDTSKEKVASQCNFVFEDLENTKHFEELTFDPMNAIPKTQDVFSIRTDSKHQVGKDYSSDKNNEDCNADENENCNNMEKDLIFDINKSISIKEEGIQNGDESTHVGDESIRVTNDDVQAGDVSTCSGDEGNEVKDENICIEDEGIQARNETSVRDNGILGDKSTHIKSEVICEDESKRSKDEIIQDELNNKDTLNQESTLEVSTSVMKETDSVFDSKMREIEERALKKFKGSFLDNIF